MSFQRQGSPEPITHKGAFVVDDATVVNCPCGRALGRYSHGVLEASNGFLVIGGKREVRCECGREYAWDSDKVKRLAAKNGGN
jgi:hypothetical protein